MMELIFILVCIYFLLNNCGSSHRVITNPDPDEIDYVIPSDDD